MVYPGNLQGRHARETGSKGATLVTLLDGELESLEHLTLDVVRWSRLEIDISQSQSADEVLQSLGARLQEESESLGDRVLAARIITVGSGPAHAELVGRREYWINEIRNLAVQIDHESI